MPYCTAVFIDWGNYDLTKITLSRSTMKKCFIMVIISIRVFFLRKYGKNFIRSSIFFSNVFWQIISYLTFSISIHWSMCCITIRKDFSSIFYVSNPVTLWQIIHLRILQLVIRISTFTVVYVCSEICTFLTEYVLRTTSDSLFFQDKWFCQDKSKKWILTLHLLGNCSTNRADLWLTEYQTIDERSLLQFHRVLRENKQNYRKTWILHCKPFDNVIVERTFASFFSTICIEKFLQRIADTWDKLTVSFIPKCILPILASLDTKYNNS